MSTAGDTQPVAIDASTERLLGRSAFERVPRPRLVLDASFRIQMANAEFLRAFGARREEVIGRSLSELGTDPRALSGISEHLRRALGDAEGIVRLDVSGAFGKKRCA